MLKIPARKASAIFGLDPSGKSGSLPIDAVIKLGRERGFMRRPSRAVCASVFVTKGGVLKTSLTLNIARTAALHGLKVCVIGLDMQADITSLLLSDFAAEEHASLAEALAHANDLKGLSDVFQGSCTIDDVIYETDLPTLHLVPETPELVALDQSLINRNRREYWLKEDIIDKISGDYDLILLDCSPNWNRLITNALVASDVLISPVECRVTNFRNLKIFRALIGQFRKEMQLKFAHWFVATKLSENRKLSREIYSWYQSHLTSKTEVLLSVPIHESVVGEEATAMRLSVVEYQPRHRAAAEMRLLMTQLSKLLVQVSSSRVLSGGVHHVARA